MLNSLKYKILLGAAGALLLGGGLVSQTPASLNIQGYNVRTIDCFESKDYWLNQVINRPDVPENKNIHYRELTLLERATYPDCANGYLVQVGTPVAGATLAEVNTNLKGADRDPLTKVYNGDSEVAGFTKVNGTMMADPPLIARLLGTEVAYAVPTDNIDSYAAGNLDGKNGGTGWAADYGNGTLNCGTMWQVVAAGAESNPNEARGTSDTTHGAADWCQRQLNPALTGTEVPIFFASTSATNNRWQYFLAQDSAAGPSQPGVQWKFDNATAQIMVVDNVTWTNVRAYSKDVWYRETVTLDVANEAFTIQSCDGPTYTSCSTSATLHFNSYLSITYTALTYQDFNDGGDVTGKVAAFDTIGGASVAAAPGDEIINKFEE